MIGFDVENNDMLQTQGIRGRFICRIATVVRSRVGDCIAKCCGAIEDSREIGASES
jgi:hypothetical protein